MSPHPRLLLMVAISLPLLIASIWMPPLGTAATIINLFVVSLAVADWLVSPPLKRLKIVREVPEVLSLGTSNPVELHVRSYLTNPIAVELFDEVPQPGSAIGCPVETTASTMQSARPNIAGAWM